MSTSEEDLNVINDASGTTICVTHDPSVPLNRLAWNRLPGPYRFHYTTTAASLAIVQEKAYKVQARTRSGLYVTNLQPGQLSDEKLLNTIFDGMRDLERVQSAVVLVLDSSLPLEKVGAAAWCHRAPGGL